ncbi:MAG: cell division protein FtsA [Gammaproteobacteria bacterium]|nr:cell division protein FtsA [Gammaproteobacteria bacterium]
MNDTTDKNGNIIVGLDIGTTKVVALVGEISDKGELNVVGMGSHLSLGIKKGVVVDIESTVLSIRRAVEDAEKDTGYKITSVYAGIAGSHVKSMNSSGAVSIRDGEVTRADVDRVIDSTRAIAIPPDERILHVVPQEYTVNSQNGVKEPLGMSGMRLEARAHLVTCAVNAMQDIEKCIKRCGLKIEQLVLEQLASSEAVLTPDERELGVCLVDVGGGTTDIAIFTQDALQYTGVIPVAGDQVTSDIATALRTPRKNADELKIRHGCALVQLTDPEENIEVPSVGDRDPRELSLQNLAEVVEPRYEELFHLIEQTLVDSGMKNLLAAGIVMTGGSSKMLGAVELAEEVFHEPVRVGAPQNVKGRADITSNPIYSTGVGLLLYGLKDFEERGGLVSQKEEKTAKSDFLGPARRFFRRFM